MYRFLYVLTPSVVPTRVQVVEIALVGICLSLKRDVAVSVAPHGQSHQPLNDVSEVEKHEQHLALLSRVDALVVNQLVAQIHAMMHKQHPQQINRREAMKGQYRGAHNLHGCKGTIFFLIHTPHIRASHFAQTPKR